MSLLHRAHRDGNGQSQSAGLDTPAPAGPVIPPQTVQPTAATPARVPRTRAGAAWAALITAALLAVLLIIFLIQNTHSTEISFLWMTASTPLAVALLIAAVGSALLTLTLGTARIAQLRRMISRSRT